MAVEAVRRVNKKNPNAVPLVWIHDYHLMLAANYIRNACNEEDLEIKLAFFLHIPFPSWDIMRLFPWDDELLQGILGCDSVGFHVDDYCLNFIDCCKRRLGCRIDRDQMLVEHVGEIIAVHPLPISIPYERFETMAKETPELVNHSKDTQIILGIDRLDYTKGLVNRIRAVELLFEKYPENIEKAIFLQVVVPSRTDVKEYQDLKEEIDQLVGRINGRFATPNWSPIRYIYGCVPQAKLAGFYRDASVALVTPLRDGMNLVAKEFVACQTEEPGVLILSPFAGAGSTMHEALSVNPYERNRFTDTIQRALTMSKDERELRMQLLRLREKERDVNFWLRSFLKTVDCLVDEPGPAERNLPFTEEDFSPFLASYVHESSRLALLLDYDGTLAPIAPHPDLAYMPEETKRVLERLTNMPDVNIAIISGRSLENVKQMVGIEGITYAGNHGFEVLHPDGSKFVQSVPPEYEIQLEKLKTRISNESCRDGAWLENKGATVTWHYRQVPEEKVSALIETTKKIFADLNIKLHQSHMAFEAKPPVTWNKGRAAIYILRTLFGVDWSNRVSTIYAGDDNTDEDAMKALEGMAITFRVTKYSNIRTAATYRVPSTDAIFTMLRWVEKRIGSRCPFPRSRTASFTGGTRSRSRTSSFNGLQMLKSPLISKDENSSNGSLSPPIVVVPPRPHSPRPNLNTQLELDENLYDAANNNPLKFDGSAITQLKV